MSQALQYLVSTFVDLFIMVVLLRFLLQYFRADFRNPIAQAVMQITSPVVVPVRKLVPAIGKIDTASLVVAVAISAAFILLLLGLYGLSVNPFMIAIYALVRTAMLMINVVIFAIFIGVILSWISPGYNPFAAMVGAISEPVLRPIRRFVPLLGGLDLSPLLALVLLSALKILVGSYVPGVFMPYF